MDVSLYVSLSDDFEEVLFAEIDSFSHFLLKTMFLVDGNDASKGAGYVIEEAFRNFDANAEFGHLGSEGAA